MRKWNVSVQWIGWLPKKFTVSNFSFIITKDGTVTCARRTGILGEKENFFQYHKIKQELETKLVEMYKKLVASDKYPELEQIQVFGEIYGGIYPHPDVEKVKNCRVVQQGIFYHPGIKFEIYDMRISLGEETDLKRHFMNWDDMVSIADEFGIPYSPVLFRGSMADALKVKERMASTIFAKYGLPEIDNNLAEGIVVRPVNDMTVMIRKSPERCILKKKIEEFRETIPAASAAAAKANVAKTAAEDTPTVLAAKSLAALRITDNRLDAAISKVGPLEEKANFKKVLDAFTADVAKDCSDSNADEWKALDGPGRKGVDKYVLLECRTLMAKRTKKKRPAECS